MQHRRLFSLIAAALLVLAPALCRAQEGAEREDLTLRSGRRVTASPRILLPFYLGASALADDPVRSAGFCFGIEPVGMRLSSRACPVEANVALQWSGMNFRQGRQLFQIGVPLRLACSFGKRGVVYAGTSALWSVGGGELFSPFVAVAEGGISLWGYGLRAAYTLTPVLAPASGGAKAFSLSLIIGI